VGDGEVGKTTLIIKYMGDELPERYEPTVAPSFFLGVLEVPNHVRVQLDARYNMQITFGSLQFIKSIKG
jgi:GTPase SAR1 family protein